MKFFEKSYFFNLPENLIQEKLEDIFADWGKGSFEGEFTRPEMFMMLMIY